jgi:hypothetical protein
LIPTEGITGIALWRGSPKNEAEQRFFAIENVWPIGQATSQVSEIIENSAFHRACSAGVEKWGFSTSTSNRGNGHNQRIQFGMIPRAVYTEHLLLVGGTEVYRYIRNRSRLNLECHIARQIVL